MITVLCIAFLVLILAGVPIAFAMLSSTVLAVFASDALPFALIAQRVGNGIDNFTYLAIPLFILAGVIMEHSGISGRLVALARALVGHVPGGMGHTVIVSEIFFSGISGASLSDASAIGSLTNACSDNPSSSRHVRRASILAYACCWKFGVAALSRYLSLHNTSISGVSVAVSPTGRS